MADYLTFQVFERGRLESEPVCGEILLGGGGGGGGGGAGT